MHVIYIFIDILFETLSSFELSFCCAQESDQNLENLILHAIVNDLNKCISMRT